MLAMYLLRAMQQIQQRQRKQRLDVFDAASRIRQRSGLLQGRQGNGGAGVHAATPEKERRPGTTCKATASGYAAIAARRGARLMTRPEARRADARHRLRHARRSA